MSIELKNLQEKRNGVADEIRRMRDVLVKEDREFNSEEKVSWEKANKDFSSLTERMNAIKSADATLTELAGGEQRGSRPGDEDFGKPNKGRSGIDADKSARSESAALKAWAKRASGRELDESEIKACRSLGFNPLGNTVDFRMDRGILTRGTDPQSTTAAAGGYTIPQGFVPNLERALKAFAIPLQLADVITTDTGNTLPWPTINDTGTSGALLAENAQVAVGDMTFAQTSFAAYKYTSKEVLLSYELITDSAFDLASEVGSMLGERLGRALAAAYTTGTGSSQPGGIVTGTTVGKTAASTTAIAADELIDLIHSVDPAYRVNPGVGFMAHDAVIAAIRKLKDDNNNYLWQPGYQMGQPDRLLGYPVYTNQNMASTIEAAAKTVVFGDFKKFKVRMVSGVRLVRMDERYADYDQVGFVAFVRTDSKVLNAGTNPLKRLVQAAS